MLRMFGVIHTVCIPIIRMRLHIRGFSHSELSFVIERTMDLLSQKLQMDPLELRYINAIRPGNTTPTRVLLNKSNLGDLPHVLRK